MTKSHLFAFSSNVVTAVFETLSSWVRGQTWDISDTNSSHVCRHASLNKSPHDASRKAFLYRIKPGQTSLYYPARLQLLHCVMVGRRRMFESWLQGPMTVCPAVTSPLPPNESKLKCPCVLQPPPTPKTPTSYIALNITFQNLEQRLRYEHQNSEGEVFLYLTFFI